MYYRVAIQINSSPTWKWKSTLLSSLWTLFQWLRLHQALPQDQLRVCSSASPEGLTEQLARENNGLASSSAAVEQFLRERKLSSGESILGASKRRQQTSQEEQGAAPIAVITKPLRYEHDEETATLGEWKLSPLERRRLELENGEGGDHDSPYTFTLPTYTPQALAWMKLLVRVQDGELQP